MNDPELTPRRDDKTLSPEPLVPALTGEEDQMLLALLRRWLEGRHVGGNKRAADAIRRWAAVKGLDG